VNKLYNPDLQHRRSIRLQGYDYAQAGAYFVTICTFQRQSLFGDVIGGEVRLNEYGQIVAAEWSRTSLIRREVALDTYVVMPNHLHAIVVLTNAVGAHGRAPLHSTTPHRPPKSLGALIAGFKSAVTKLLRAHHSQ
jgi:putative transposase